jgi:hypothetical protein
LWSAKNEVYGARLARIECPEKREVQNMGEGCAGREVPFKDRQMWRLLLARLHPDAGGDHELFLFACALKDELCGERLFANGTASRDESGTGRSFLMWRSTMDSWASRNREALKRPRPWRGGVRNG